MAYFFVSDWYLLIILVCCNVCPSRGRDLFSLHETKEALLSSIMEREVLQVCTPNYCPHFPIARHAFLFSLFHIPKEKEIILEENLL